MCYIKLVKEILLKVKHPIYTSEHILKIGIIVLNNCLYMRKTNVAHPAM